MVALQVRRVPEGEDGVADILDNRAVGGVDAIMARRFGNNRSSGRASSSESMPSEMLVKLAMSLKSMVSNCFSAPGLRSLGLLANFLTSLGER